MALRRPLRAAAGLAVYGLGAGVAYELSRPQPQLPTHCERCSTFNALAPQYDFEIERDELSSGILDLRRQMIGRASGRVLEVGAGTGRNLAYYTDAVSELIVSDYSEAMLQVAAEKAAKLGVSQQVRPLKASSGCLHARLSHACSRTSMTHFS